uniref:Uncharacterized protein n=1 Tax=Tetraselmis sp. GSL018 TaxID=582737 RepID=A0A061RCS4_9CHLO|mmetsp:Transcript_35383/g.83872  ORF Transcript_35383/g.83872 Transcript_35383/m.83872 type:complete len:141 (-) Transcript_35383:156-578(-)|eukprot:CAMPEP_0177583678 /NCGR_PEP_ID=MMETSP0419_2-20121207/3452_1 /TAXON_ID=582737 /ORGANISM="Tetraselmis sp., Strain GSL018" /LENGTH=140 /DNA_ID=CAMNT_0019073089 /DNA_START=445 /DNA_END=867 /DNA_ORIENTATION=+
MILRGHFVDSDTSTCFGLHGTALAEIQECTRDEDKKLLKLIVTDYRGREVCTAVEKSGGDATKLKTPETDANWLAEWPEEVLDEELEVDFVCRKIKSGAEAQRHLLRYLPALSGADAVVTQGSMELRAAPFPPLRRAAAE